MGRTKARLLALGALIVGVLVLVPLAQGRTSTNLSLDVTFFANGSISTTLPNGTPVGVASGSPTVIPAGFYTVVLTGPGGCTQLPHFVLKGPGENIVDNMTEGEVANAMYNAYFLPNSTYTWSNDASPSVVYTFTTSADVQGTPPSQAGPNGITSSKHGTAVSQNPLGDGIVPLRGTLAGAVSASGKLTLAFKGKSAAILTAGRYKITVTDQSAKNGFMLVKAKRTVSVTGVTFVGKHTATVNLTAGKWAFTPSLTGKTYSLTVK